VHNDRLVDALNPQASSALQASPGARAYYDKQRDRGLDHGSAPRHLANRLVGILPRCLKTHTRYGETTAWSHHAEKRAADTLAPGMSCRPHAGRVQDRCRPVEFAGVAEPVMNLAMQIFEYPCRSPCGEPAVRGRDGHFERGRKVPPPAPTCQHEHDCGKDRTIVDRRAPTSLRAGGEARNQRFDNLPQRIWHQPQ